MIFQICAALRSVASSTIATPLVLCALLASLSTPARAHTWLEEMQVIGPNGSYIGDLGYARGYIARTDPGFNGFSTKWQLPSPDTDLGRIRINSSMFACHPSQRTSNYTSEYPQLSVAPGSYVAMKYLENGHVTQPWIPAGKPDRSGTVFVFGTYSPDPEEKLTDVLAWTSDGSGGSGKGFLLTAQAYDDGRCHQLNQAPLSINRQIQFPNRIPGQPTSQLEQWCETDLFIPIEAKIGQTLTTYWVWSWDTAMRTEGALCGKDEYYTTCSDFNVIDGGANLAKIAAMPRVHTLGQQDPQTQAVSDYMSRTALTATPKVITDESCTYAQSDVTTSSVPASLTEMTTMPSGLLSSTVSKAIPTYVAGQPQQIAKVDAGQSAAAASTAAATSNAAANSTSAATSTAAATSSSAATPSSTATSSPATTSTPDSSTSTTTSTTISTLAPTNPALSSTTPGSASHFVSFVTITIFTDSASVAASSLPPSSTSSTLSAAMAVVSSDGVVREVASPTARRRHAHVRRDLDANRSFMH